MAEIVLVTGGCRSGKSAYAQQLAERIHGRRLFVATCPVIDDEMERRIEAHREARRSRGWQTIEEQVDLADVFLRHREHDVFLVDCVTLWINNLMYRADLQDRPFGEAEATQHCEQVLAALASYTGTAIFVTNEVGMGIVPENVQARRYRDLVGRANQTIAAQADTVTLVTCGIPLHLKEASR